MLTRKQIYSIEEIERILKPIVLENVDHNKKKLEIDLDGDSIYALSDRYKLFFTKGYKCTCCGLEGKFFAKEKANDSERYHLNLYAIDKNGNEVLMTKDHIIPYSKGGKNELKNYQPMCEPCNKRKSTAVENNLVNELLEELKACEDRAREIRKLLDLREKRKTNRKKKEQKKQNNI